MKKLTTAFFMALAFSPFLKAEIALPDIISDNMVLQQQTDAMIWGWSNPNSEITITPSWSKSYTVKSNKNGYWSAKIATPEASFVPHTIKISGDNTELNISNVLVGEVWFCTGQSNMEMPLRGFWGQPVEGAAQAIAYSGKYPGVRMATVPKSEAAKPLDRTSGRWLVSSPENAPEFSALGYFFATSLSDILNVPVGIVTCAYGGSKLESWLPEDIVSQYDDIDVKAEIDGTAKVDDWHRAVIRYNAMLNPVVGYTIKGFLWNQGESNVGQHDRYPTRLVTMVNHWRDRWGNHDLPFYQVELPGWDYGDPNGTGAALFRECQHKAAGMMGNGGIVCTSDLVYPQEVNIIHASQKKTVGERMAFLVGADVYGINALPHLNPQYKNCQFNGDHAIITFENAEGFPLLKESLEGFEVAGEDKIFYPAEVSVAEEGVIPALRFSSSKVPDIKSVRYCFKNFIPGKVHGMNGLPLIPFRTDNWNE